MQIDFSAAYDRVNHLGILYKFCSVDVGGSVLSVMTQFQSNYHIKLWWMVVGVNWLTLYQECISVVTAGPSAVLLPCGKPEIIGTHSLAAPSTTTFCLRSERNSVQMDCTLPPTPIDFNLNKRPLLNHSIEGCTKVELNYI